MPGPDRATTSCAIANVSSLEADNVARQQASFRYRPSEEENLRMISSPAADAVGRVTLVGAGPGDPDLLTVRAVRAIQSADAILFDALIDSAILDLSRPEARRIDVGKRCGRHSMHQDAINRLIVKLALSGAHVVRLKGGDPFVFGRGGEELDSLRAAGVQIDVVPGVTAACAAAASLHIPLTYRDLARSVHFITGHGSNGAVPEHDWRALAASGGTIVTYMASKTFCHIASRLMNAGLAPSTPAVSIENISRPDETHLCGTLATLPALMACNERAGPTLVLIGEVVERSRVFPGTAHLAA
jgi:uroporphyrin-III C-methyltransferase